MRRNHTKELHNVLLYDQLYFTSEKFARATVNLLKLFFRYKASPIFSLTARCGSWNGYFLFNNDLYMAFDVICFAFIYFSLQHKSEKTEILYTNLSFHFSF